MHLAKDIFQKILHPMDYDEFLDDYVSDKPLALLGNGHSERKLMLGDDPAQTILKAFEQFAPQLTCHAHSPIKPPPVPHKVDSAKAFHALINKYHIDDYTVRIPGVDALTFELQQYLRAIETLLSVPADAAIFWSHAGAAAPVHHDEYDIIAIQLAGKKKWFVSSDEPTLPNKWSKAGEGPPTLQNFQIYDVAPGDFLYLPRGTAHTVQSTTESIHLSIGFVPVTTRDVIMASFDHLSDLDRPLRGNANGRADQALSGEPDIWKKLIDGGLKKLADQCEHPDFITAAMEQRRARTIFGLSKLPRNKTGGTLSLDSSLRHHPMAISHISKTPEIIDFTIPGEHILVHLGAEEAMRFIADTPAFTVREITGGLDEEVRLALAQKLYESGFLEMAD